MPEQEWVKPEYLDAAMEDLLDVLKDVATGASKGPEIYTWLFERRGRSVGLEIRVRRLSGPELRRYPLRVGSQA